MRAMFVSATFVAFALAAPLASATAADLDDDRYAAPPYDEQGYADDDYDDAPPPPPGRYSAAPSDGYRPSDDAPMRRGSIKDGYPVPMSPTDERGRWDRTERYDPPPPPFRRGPRFVCLDPWQIRARLRHQGWIDIRPMGGDGAIVFVRARRFDSSSVFRLRLERCSGDILAARPYYLRSFAFHERPWRY